MTERLRQILQSLPKAELQVTCSRPEATTSQSGYQAAGSRAGARNSPRGEDAGQGAETMTDHQIAQVKTILSKYDAKPLTADQAKAIHEAFCDCHAWLRTAVLVRGP